MYPPLVFPPFVQPPAAFLSFTLSQTFPSFPQPLFPLFALPLSLLWSSRAHFYGVCFSLYSLLAISLWQLSLTRSRNTTARVLHANISISKEAQRARVSHLCVARFFRFPACSTDFFLFFFYFLFFHSIRSFFHIFSVSLALSLPLLRSSFFPFFFFFTSTFNALREWVKRRQEKRFHFLYGNTLEPRRKRESRLYTDHTHTYTHINIYTYIHNLMKIHMYVRKDDKEKER